ncbi:hypothetical protein RFY44_13280 [Acinetobacter bereziniae]|uniref:hypothetical protein n=1 Tax=Acinetobacter bereziniae TaxID=106648 RepID=UPI001900A688|nr:hypothetical protein [Acinetobacter bereziniae]MBJ8445837.1 hypothetical protein [Acinetobacter bereziniae]MBJ8454311.1 hypothetical protein [Acinetobacter bereziniae]MBJ8458622.1 hypothetical protein [Acinetobacter bereziniae]MDQ9819844.1 hypothetical protein [Acinetobacter bereziniae]MDV8157145.1 hypothetical protein [Acinetobacter bereziniae]
MKFLILILTIFLISAFAFLFKSNNNDCIVGNSENSNVGNSYDVRVGKNISRFVDENKIFLNYNQKEIINRYKKLNSNYMVLKVLDKLPVEVGFADGTVGNNMEDNKNYMSNLDANINFKTGYIFFKSTNYVPYDNKIENNIAKMLGDQVYVINANKVDHKNLDENIKLFIKKIECSTSSQEEVVEWNINDMHIILEASGNKNEKQNSLFFTVYFTKKTDKKYETSIY